ncbi:unnamed protein product [Trifolium pratense]|uniref:Uncharacterized protein n=1 Tax=Trifolium pratense TaxID=57577 RepID=A0ACB0LTR2_TRIPR|nr:unnamed protein product [Trifolium pratense]
MENYLRWVQALATAWGFMLLVGLLCCCLSTKPRQDGDVNSGSGGCTCDGGGHGCICYSIEYVHNHGRIPR